jgi:hypothetical protein
VTNEVKINGGLSQVWDVFVGSSSVSDFLASGETVDEYVADLPNIFSDWEDGDPFDVEVVCSSGESGSIVELLTRYIEREQGD